MTDPAAGFRPACMLVHSYYEEDARVRREAEALVRAGRAVDVYALRRRGEAATAVIGGVTVQRLGVRRHQGAGIPTYLAEYAAFFALALAAATRAHRRRRYGLVQVHTLPDILAFAGLPLRLAGVPLLIDLHEAMPEFFAMRFPRASSAPVQAALRLQERLAIAAADAAITVNDALRDRLVGLGVPADKVTVVMNTPDLALFDPAAQPGRPFLADGTLRLVYTGALTPTYEVEVAIEAVRRLRASRPDCAVVLDLYGRGDAEPDLRGLVARLDLADAVRFHGRIPLEAVPAAIAAADIGLAPTRRSEMTDHSLSTKLFEYAAMGKPVVASSLPTVARYFNPDTVAGYRPGDPDDLARAVLDLVDDAPARESRVTRTARRVHELGWDREAARYVALVDRLAAGTGWPRPADLSA
ncbi:MAG: glycosyltransferase [Chloroflexi bacterium]|nr:glycosyltransferase [Chloroflexota bacterium]